MSASRQAFRRRFATLTLVPLLAALVAIGTLHAGLSGAAAAMAGIAVLMAGWWINEALPLWATACLPLLLFPLTGIASVGATLLDYLDPVNFLFLGGMWIAACMQQWGLHRRIALGVVDVLGTEPRFIVLGFMIATAFVSLWISNTATAMMMFPIARALMLECESDSSLPRDRMLAFGQALMLGVAYAASLGGMGTKIGTAPNLVYVRQAEAMGTQVDFVDWLSVGLPLVLISVPLAWAWLVFFAARLPGDFRPASQPALARTRASLGAMSTGERVAAVAFICAAIGWVFRRDIALDAFTLPGWWDALPLDWASVLGRPVSELPAPWSDILSRDIGDTLVALVVGTSLLFLPVSLRPPRMALSLRQAANIPWGLLVLLGGGFALAHGIAASGLSTAIAGLVAPVAGMPTWLAGVTLCLVAVLLSEVASNTATASILLPLIAAMEPTLGASTQPLMMATALAASFGFMLPAGTPPNALAYASGYLTVARMVRVGLVVDLAGAVLVALLCLWLMKA
jgi:solute carrier family 13 (sodium-dependent dicarboxylate transporter), member 2/3/5